MSPRPSAAPGPLRVLASPAGAGDADNPYARLFYDGLRNAGDVTVDDFTRRRLLDRYDVVHVHWPEFLVRWERLATALPDLVKVLLLLAVARSRGSLLVWTGHDLRPHDTARPRLESVFFRAFVRMVDLWVSLGDAATRALVAQHPALADVPVVVARHGHYRDVYPQAADRAQARRALGLPPDGLVVLMVGMLRAYKNAQGLMETFAATRAPAENLVVAGRPHDAALADSLTAAAHDRPGVHLRLGHVADDELALLHGAADVVVLPYRSTTTLHSGAALMALGFDRPVVVNDTLTMRELQAVVGSSWVHLFTGGPAEALAAARVAATAPREARAPLAELDWTVGGRQVLAAFRSAKAGGLPVAAPAADDADITVVIPAFRAERFIGTAVRSALAQTPAPREVVVVDDCSPDGTAEAARQAGARVVMQDRNQGPGVARAVGVRAATSPWVAFLDADDEYLPGHLARLWAARGDHVLVSDAARGDRTGRWYGEPGRSPRVLRHPMQVAWPDNPVNPSTAMARRDALLAVGGFAPGRHSEDLDTWMRLLEHGSALVLPELGSRYGQHDEQATTDDRKMQQGTLDVVLAFRDRPWFRPAHERAVTTRARWDVSRPAAVADPRGWPALLTLLRHRRRVRARHAPC